MSMASMMRPVGFSALLAIVGVVAVESSTCPSERMDATLACQAESQRQYDGCLGQATHLRAREVCLETWEGAVDACEARYPTC